MWYRYKYTKYSQENNDEDYRGLHTAPMHDTGSPLHDLAETYPEDFYGPNGAKYYGHYGNNHPTDRETISIMQSMRNKPNRLIRIYRAVPKIPTNEEQIAEYVKQKAYIHKTGKIPKNAEFKTLDKSVYYDWLCEKIEELKIAPPVNIPVFKINPGDWITISRKYAQEHGNSQFDGKYRILSKLVRVKDIFTNGDSIHEWGYDPQP
jgi:hypothetical protein